MSAIRLLDLPADAVFQPRPRPVDMTEDDLYQWSEAKDRHRGTPLSPMEMRVLRDRATGEPCKETAHRHGITENTVKNQLNSVYGKLGVGSLVEAFVVMGWLRVPDAPTQRLEERAYRSHRILRDLVRAMDAARVLLAHVDDIPEPFVGERQEEA